MSDKIKNFWDTKAKNKVIIALIAFSTIVVVTVLSELSVFIYLNGFKEVDNTTIEELINNGLEIRAKIYLGILAIIGIGVQAWRSKSLHEQVKGQNEANKAQKETDNNNFVLAQYTEAIKFLKSENMSETLGGIYILEKILNGDSDADKAYHNTIIEILCAYVREKRPITEGKLEDTEDKLEDTEGKLEDTEDKLKNIEDKLKNIEDKIGIDIQTVINVIGKRKDFNVDDAIINLVQIDLNLFIFHHLNYFVGTFYGSSFYKGSFYESNIFYFSFNNTNIRDCSFNQMLMPPPEHFDNATIKKIEFKNAYVLKSTDWLKEFKDIISDKSSFNINDWQYKEKLSKEDKDILTDKFKVDDYNDYRVIVKKDT